MTGKGKRSMLAWALFAGVFIVNIWVAIRFLTN